MFCKLCLYKYNEVFDDWNAKEKKELKSVFELIELSTYI